MKLKMFKSNKSIKLLESKIHENLSSYIGQDDSISSLINTELTVDIECEQENNWQENLKLLEDDDHDTRYDLDNSEIVWRHLGSIDIRLAYEPRLWVYLNHSVGFKYIKQRIRNIKNTSKDVKETIKSYFFGKGRGGLVREPSLSGLWFRSYIARKINFLEPEDSLKMLCSNSDLYYSISGRPSILRSQHVLNTVFMAAKEIIDNHNDKFLNDRDLYRPWFKNINFEGGYKLLDAIPEHNLKNLFIKLSEGANEK